MTATLRIETPRWAEPLLKPSRYKGIYGGRGSGKSHERAEALIERHILNPNCKSVCIREIQKSLKQSVKALLEDKIIKLGVGHLFEVQESCIKNRLGNGIVIFQGMQNHTADSIKSLEGFLIAWVEEGQSLSQRSLDLLRPTIRSEGSEIWVTWNPRFEDDPIELLLRGADIPKGAVVVEANYQDNPWFPDVLREEMEFDKSIDIRKYNHVWRGKYFVHMSDIIKAHWFHIKDISLEGRKCRSWDLAFTTKKANDYSAGALVCENNDNYQVQDMIQVKLQYPDLKKLIMSTAEIDGPDVPVIIEEAGQQIGYVDDIRRDRRMANFEIKGQKPKGDKLARAMKWASRLESGQVTLLRAPWNAKFIGECGAFTNDDSHAHDDMIDGVSGGWQYFVSPSSGVSYI